MATCQDCQGFGYVQAHGSRFSNVIQSHSKGQYTVDYVNCSSCNGTGRKEDPTSLFSSPVSAPSPSPPNATPHSFSTSPGKTSSPQLPVGTILLLGFVATLFLYRDHKAAVDHVLVKIGMGCVGLALGVASALITWRAGSEYLEPSDSERPPNLLFGYALQAWAVVLFAGYPLLLGIYAWDILRLFGVKH